MNSLLEIKDELEMFIQKEKSVYGKPDNYIIASSMYSSVLRYEQEIHVLEKFPKILGPLREIHQLEEYILNEMDNSSYRVFYNSCPHRGARLKKSDSSDHLICPYHGWSFDKEGVLLKSTGHNCPFPKGSLKLRELKTHLLGGMLFSGDFTKMEGAYYKEIQAFSGKARFLESKKYEIRCNWKFLVESLLETYHFPFAHDIFLAQFDNAFFSLASCAGFNSRVTVPLQNFDETRKINGFDGINIMYYIFPYSFVLFMSSGYVWFKIDPLKKDLCQFVFSLFSYSAEKDGVARNSFTVLEKILNQDFLILEAQQMNTLHEQRYHFTGYEKLIKHLHKNLETIINKVEDFG